MMAITLKIHANDTKKKVVTKLGVKVTDVQWIEFEFLVKKRYLELKMSTSHTWTDSKTEETENAIQTAMDQCKGRADFGLGVGDLRELVKWKLVQLHQQARRKSESGEGQEQEFASSTSAPYDPVRDCR